LSAYHAKKTDNQLLTFPFLRCRKCRNTYFSRSYKVHYIYENKVDNYADFLMICIEESDDCFDVAVNSNTLALNKMIDAIWQKNQRKDFKGILELSEKKD